MKTSSRFNDLPPYIPIEPFEVLSRKLGRPMESIIKLDANENPYGPSPRARQAIASLNFPHIYPDPENRALRAALAQFTGISEQYLFAGAGADELLDLILRVVLEPEDGVIICPPTFGMYRFDTQINSGKVIEINRKDDFSLDIAAIEKAVTEQQAKILFITNPNNPDGGLTSRQDIEKLLKLPVLVIVDEAYIEFSVNDGSLGRSISLISEVPKRENLVVLRTFSKWAGLAGLRVGYGAFPTWLLDTMWKIKQPYNVNVAGNEAALASLNDLPFLSANIERIKSERERLFTRLQQIEYLKPFPSHANFIICKVNHHSAEELKSYLEKRGILVRYYQNKLLQDCIRISIGTPENSNALVFALESFANPDTMQTEVSENSETTQLSITGVVANRCSQVTRNTRETQIQLSLNLDGTGKHHIQTGIPFFDHMLAQISVHGLFDIELIANGDLEIDAHHTIEDVGLALGQGFREALGNRAGITRMSSAFCPMDDSLARVVVDFSGRPYARIQVNWVSDNVGGIATSLFSHFMESFSSEARCNLHAEVFYGQDDHHQAEALFKAFGRAMDAAIRMDARRAGSTPSSKGVLF